MSGSGLPRNPTPVCGVCGADFLALPKGFDSHDHAVALLLDNDEAVKRLRPPIEAVIARWYRLRLLRFDSHDDGSDDLLLRDEIAKAVVAALRWP